MSSSNHPSKVRRADSALRLVVELEPSAFAKLKIAAHLNGILCATTVDMLSVAEQMGGGTPNPTLLQIRLRALMNDVERYLP